MTANSSQFGRISRRRLLGQGGAGALAASLPVSAFGQSAPAIITSETMRIKAPLGVQAGDIQPGRSIIWSKADREARMVVEWSTTESFNETNRVTGPLVTEETDYTGKVDLIGLPSDQRIFYRVRFLDLGDFYTMSEPVTGFLMTPPREKRSIRFVWGGDTAGQGWGINPEFGGMRMFKTMADVAPEFFIYSGDTIYADGPMKEEVELDDGTVWKNMLIEEKTKVAETLREFRMNYAYNLMDENVRAFNAAVPALAQWDDHEVTNNWFWELRKDGDERYKEGSAAILAARGMRAFHDYMPVRQHPLERERIYQRFSYGPSLDVFRIDLRSYRGPNNDGMQTELSPEARILGATQLAWLKRELAQSEATWKVIASDMPIGLIVWDNFREKRGAEAISQGDHGAARGRELEIADLLRHIRDEGVKNVVWLTADVHYTAAHYYDPNKAQFQDFAPFWEFVSGPLHAGTFGPNDLDATFGPEVRFVKAPEAGQVNLPPSAGMQFFGEVEIDGASEVMSVHLKDIDGTTLFTQAINPEV